MGVFQEKWLTFCFYYIIINATSWCFERLKSSERRLLFSFFRYIGWPIVKRVICVFQFELIEDESADEIVKCTRGMFSMFDDFQARKNYLGSTLRVDTVMRIPLMLSGKVRILAVELMVNTPTKSKWMTTLDIQIIALNVCSSADVIRVWFGILTLISLTVSLIKHAQTLFPLAWELTSV